MRRSPTEPTKDEVIRHKLTHTPYRSWCPECVKARAKMPPHRKIPDDGEKAIPTVHIDYWFMRDKRGAELIAVATMKDDASKTFKAHVVNSKGNVDGVAEQLVRDLEEIGYNGKVIVKCDQENALVDLVKAIAKCRGDKETVVEHSKAKDSQTNGVAERAVQSIEGLVRTMKFALEKRLGVQISSSHPLMAWIVEHAAETLNRFHVGPDGRTPFERIKGKAYKGEVVEFGRIIYHRHPGRVEGGSMEPRWSEGVWLGKTAKSDENIISDETGRIVKAGGISLKTDIESWDRDVIMGVKVFPNGLNEPRAVRRTSIMIPPTPLHSGGESRGEEVREPDERDGPEIADPVERSRGPADIYIRYEDLKKSGGFTAGCRKCQAMKGGDNSRSRMSHNAECRARVRTWMAKDSIERQKVEQADLRKNEYLAKRIEQDEIENPNAKQPRIAVDGDMMDDLSPGASGSDISRPSVKRSREGDDEENLRPTHFRSLDEERGEHIPPEMLENNGEIVDLGGQAPMSLATIENKAIEIYNAERRGGHKHPKYLVAEAFSPPRVSKRARDRGLSGGWSLDWLTIDPMTGRKWDLRDKDVQKKVIDMVMKDKPELLVLCPPCTLFSMLQNLAGDPRVRCPAKWQEAVAMVDFAVQLCRMQAKSGRKFLFEHPLGASSWTRTELKNLMHESGIYEAKTHMCMFGMQSTDKEGAAPALKPTRFLTNSTAVQGMLEKKCSRDHRHVQLLNGRSAAAALYPMELVDAIIDGILMEKVQAESAVLMNVQELHEEQHVEPYFVDDSTGKTLDSKKVRAARKEEMETFDQMNVYEYIKKEDYDYTGGKKIGVRWVDIDKGHKIRSRLVAQEFAHGENRDDLFAGTPPLVATKALLSDFASNGASGPSGRIMVLDIKRAFLYGNIAENIAINLPEEDPMHGKGYYGKLLKAMYGTRAAPQAWQGVVKNVMSKLGFSCSLKFPCVYFNPHHRLRVVTHVDDFICSGDVKELRWLRDELAKEFDLTHEILGPGQDETREIKFLGRTIKWTSGGLEYSGDKNHSKTLLEEWGMTDCKTVVTPGVAEEKTSKEQDDDEEALSRDQCRAYRRAAARLNYMAQDRPDLAYAAKELSRAMANPKPADVTRLKRAIRYLRGAPTATLQYKWQERPSKLVTFSDSDWAGCVKTRRSTSGGVVTYGSHTVQHWSSTQATIALSSAEAELNAVVKATVETIGVIDLYGDIGEKMTGQVRTDSSAAKGIVSREGCGKLKHLSVKQLWVQEAIDNDKVTLLKVLRAENPSDALTHHWLGVEGERHFPVVGLAFELPKIGNKVATFLVVNACMQGVANSHLRTALSDQSGRVGPNSVKAGASLLLPAAPSHRGFRRETRSPEDGDVN